MNDHTKNSKKSPYTWFITGIKLGKKKLVQEIPFSKIWVEIVLPLLGCFLFSFFPMNIFICAIQKHKIWVEIPVLWKKITKFIFEMKKLPPYLDSDF
jgi:hypothetical protein